MMRGRYNKFFAAVVPAIASIINAKYPMIAIDAATQAWIIGVATSIAVYMVPNRP